MLFLLIPFSLLFLNDALDMTYQSFLQHEVSPDPGGLTDRWLIKAMLVFGFVLLILQAVSEILKSYHRLENRTLLWRTLSIGCSGSGYFGSTLPGLTEWLFGLNRFF